MGIHGVVPVLMVAAGVGLAAPAAAQIVGAAARINGVEISNLRLERHFDEYVKGKNRNISKMINPKVYKKLKREALDQLIDREVLWQAARGKDIVATDEEIQAALAQLKKELKTEEAYLRRLELAGFTEKEYADYVRQELSGRKYLDREVPIPAVDDQEIEAAYRASIHRFTRPESVRARHVLVKVDHGAGADAKEAARRRAAEIAADARRGEEFAVLAERYSEDAKLRGTGGDLGEFQRGQMVKPFEEAAFAMKPGEISDPVETQYGFHVIKVESHIAAATMPLDEVRDKVGTAVAMQKRAELAKETVAKLRAAAKIQVLVMLDPDS